MNFKFYLDQMNQMMRDNPDLSDCEVIFARDDDYEAFRPVGYTASTCNFDGDTMECDTASDVVNAILIN